jgi:hypothetical protein
MNQMQAAAAQHRPAETAREMGPIGYRCKLQRQNAQSPQM